MRAPVPALVGHLTGLILALMLAQPLLLQPAVGQARPAADAPSPMTAGAMAQRSSPCANPDALGVARVVEIDTAAGPTFGSQQYHGHDFLGDHEIVLTFDDGPMPAYTMPILKALDDQCTKAIFFSVGKMALAYPDTLKEVARRGHTVGSHTWSHANLRGTRLRQRQSEQLNESGPERASRPVAYRTGEQGVGTDRKPYVRTQQGGAEREIEMGFSAVQRALGAPPAPFFRFPYLADTKQMLGYLADRHVAIFSIDVDSIDYRTRRAEDVQRRILHGLESGNHRGILLFHDIQTSTAHAMPSLLRELRTRGYRVVHVISKQAFQSQASADDEVGSDPASKSASANKDAPLKRTLIWSPGEKRV